MNTKRSRVVDERLSSAEAAGLCLVPSCSADARWLQRACTQGIVLRPIPGAYVRTSHWEGLSQTDQAFYQMRTLMQLHPTWVFAGASAALAHGLDVGFRDLTSLCIATSEAAHTDNTRYRRIIVTGDKPVAKHGIRATSFMRTMYDCLRTMDFPGALAIADSALRMKHIPRERLALNIREVCGAKPGMERVMEIVSLADGRAENGGESRVRAQIIALGFQVPDLQRVIPDIIDEAEYRADFAWDLLDGSTVLGELDGHAKYTDVGMTKGKPIEDVLLAERHREARMTVSTERPTKVLRFSFSEACNRRHFKQLLTSYGIPRVAEVPQVART